MPSEQPSPPETGTPAGIRVLAFTCSRYRPLMLRHCLMQMQRQTYRVDHALYMNSSEEEPADHTLLHYGALLEDACEPDPGRVIVGYGPSKPYHGNYVACLGLINIDDYDLFLKVDDDDVYFRTYAAGVVADFVARRWDYSGTHSNGLLNGRRWYPDYMLADLGFEFEDLELKVPSLMPSSLAMSHKAMRAILESTDTGQIEDIQWRRLMARRPDLIMAQRSDRNFVYNIHGENASTAGEHRP